VADTRTGSASAAAREADAVDEVDREPFFTTFDDRGLAFVYQEKTSDGAVSRFNKFVRPDGD